LQGYIKGTGETSQVAAWTFTQNWSPWSNFLFF